MSSDGNKVDSVELHAHSKCVYISILCYAPEIVVNIDLTYPEDPPAPLRGEPVSPAPRRGTATENERVKTARLAVLAERTTD